MESITDLVEHSLFNDLLTLFIVCAALILDKLVHIPPSVNLLHFYRFICKRMAIKVHKDNSKQQAIIAGILSLVVLIAPILVIYYLIHAFASYAWLLDIFLTFILLSFREDAKTIVKSASAMKQHKKQLAKDTLQSKLLRDTTTLSALGVYKASEEALMLRYHHQVFCTMLWFLIFGPIAALLYRLVYESHQQWNTRLSKYRFYGACSKNILVFFQIIPSLLFSLSAILVSNPTHLIPCIGSKQYWLAFLKFCNKQQANGFFLLTLSQVNKVNTGGPLIYEGNKIARPRFTPNLKRKADDSSEKSVINLISLLNRHLIVSLLVIFAVIYGTSAP